MKNKDYTSKDLYFFFKRVFDLFFSILLFIILLIPMFIIAIIIKVTSYGSIIYWSKRIGKNNVIFNMPKFRTMIIETPPLATHLLNRPELYLTPIGRFLRIYSLDELPQLWSVFKGDMSFVGPRPALFNQKDLIKLRTKYFVHKIIPGITGLAQINGRDELTIREKVKFDIEYYEIRSLHQDFKIIFQTIKKVCINQGVNH